VSPGPGDRARERRELLIAFADLTRFAFEAARMEDAGLASMVDELYERLHHGVTAAGGTVVKFIGDAMLAVFPPGRADGAVAALLEQKRSVDRWLARRGLECRLHVKVHLGKVIAGQFGGRGDKRFDVIGKEVNACARLPSAGFSLSAAAFQGLSPRARRAFCKQELPAIYGPRR